MSRVRRFYQFFKDVYEEQERTFDPAHLRGFIDVYCAERRRVMAENLTGSSFYGEDGLLNYLNTMFDLFLVSILALQSYHDLAVNRVLPSALTA